MAEPIYWVMTPFKDNMGPTFQRAWKYDLANNTTAVGWGEMGDLTGLSVEDIVARHEQHFPGHTSRNCAEIVRFWHEIHLGEIIVARSGRSKVIGVGRVAGRPFYDLQGSRERVDSDLYPNFLPVSWKECDKEFDPYVFNMSALCRLHNPCVLDWLHGLDK